MKIQKKLIAIISWFCSPRYRRYMISLGYRKLQNRGQLDLIQNCKHKLSNLNTGVNYDSASPDIFFAAREEADLVIRQYLSKRTCEKSLCLSVYNAIGGGVALHHLPPHTYTLMQELGIPIWVFGSKIRWMFSLIVYWLYGCWMIIKLGRSTENTNGEINSGSTAFFQDLPLNAVPDRQTSFQRQDIVSWYCRWDKRNPFIKSVSHQHKNSIKTAVNGISLEYRAAGWSGYISIGNRIKYFSWGMRVASMAFLDLVRRRWWHALLFSEATKAKRIALSEERNLPAEIWFNHENYRYRPIWAHEAEAKGVKTYLYFYSVNNQTIQPASHELIISGFWHLMNWPRYLVWNIQQRNFVEKYNQLEAEFFIAHHIPYTDSNDELTQLASPAVAVFDIPSYGNEITFSLGQAYKYQKIHVVIDFYNDIIQTAKSNSLIIYSKQKSRKKSHLMARYIEIIDRLEHSKDVCIIESGISAHRLIQATQMTISAPYSTTSVIAKELGKPCCYYDPTGLLPENTSFSHGIRVIKSSKTLSDWMKKNRPS